MNIDEFLELCKNEPWLVKDHIIDYVPYEKKIDTATAIINVCCWKKETLSDGTETKKFYINSPAKYMLSLMSMFDLYTDVERDKGSGKITEQFNALNKLGAFDYIAGYINPRELNEFSMVIQMTYDDLITNEYEPHAFISSQVNRFGSLVGAMLGPVLDNIDIDKITEAVSEITNREG